MLFPQELEQKQGKDNYSHHFNAVFSRGSNQCNKARKK